MSPPSPMATHSMRMALQEEQVLAPSSVAELQVFFSRERKVKRIKSSRAVFERTHFISNRMRTPCPRVLLKQWRSLFRAIKDFCKSMIRTEWKSSQEFNRTKKRITKKSPLGSVNSRDWEGYAHVLSCTHSLEITTGNERDVKALPSLQPEHQHGSGAAGRGRFTGTRSLNTTSHQTPTEQ